MNAPFSTGHEVASPCFSTTRRVAVIDAARGVALVFMIGYHGCWDLVWFDLAHFDLLGDVIWLSVRTVILSAFLILVGVGLVLARHQGQGWRKRASRVVMVAGAAALVSAVTWWFTPGAFIFFGVLHHIAVASVLGLAFVGLPVWLTGVAACVCLLAPGVLAHPVFDAAGLSWLGLVTELPRSNDYVPLLPWFGVVLVGVALGHGILALVARGGIAAALWDWRPARRGGRAVTWAGRHSLAIYLMHQPVVFGALYLAVISVGFGPVGGFSAPVDSGAPIATREGLPPKAEGFLGSCQVACEKQGGSLTRCAGYCRCVASDLQGRGLWTAFRENRQDDAAKSATMAIVQTCAARAVAR